MNLLTFFIASMIYFVCIGIDIILFFLQIRLIFQWKPIPWLIPFDQAGHVLVEQTSLQVTRWVKTNKPLSDKGTLVIAIAVLIFIRLILTTLVNNL